MSREAVRLEEVPGIGTSEAGRLAPEIYAGFVSFLASLDADDWLAPTVCVGWTVKDISAHLLGWAEAIVSPRELLAQLRKTRARAQEFGNSVDAQNQVQVDDRKDLSTDELLTRMQTTLPRAALVRKRLARGLHYLPAYSAFLGGRSNAGYLLNVIFLRDALVHRVDIAEATGRSADLSEAESRLFHDMLHDWARRARADVVLELAGAGGGRFVAREGRSGSIAGRVTDLVKLFSGRAGVDEMVLDGERETLARYLAQPCPV